MRRTVVVVDKTQMKQVNNQVSFEDQTARQMLKEKAQILTRSVLLRGLNKRNNRNKLSRSIIVSDSQRLMGLQNQPSQHSKDFTSSVFESTIQQARNIEKNSFSPVANRMRSSKLSNLSKTSLEKNILASLIKISKTDEFEDNKTPSKKKGLKLPEILTT